MLGELVYSFFAIAFLFWGIVNTKQLLSIMLVSYIVKALFAAIGSILAILIVYIIKDHEGINVFDTDTDFNPFKIFLEEQY